MEAQTLEKTYKFNNLTLGSPDSKLSPEEVKRFYATIYPELVNAEITGPTVVGGKLQYEFKRAVGTKG